MKGSVSEQGCAKLDFIYPASFLLLLQRPCCVALGLTLHVMIASCDACSCGLRSVLNRPQGSQRGSGGAVAPGPLAEQHQDNSDNRHRADGYANG